jgi:hypothetical protein
MENTDVMLNRSPSKLKMVECKALLGCTDPEWTEIGATVQLHILLFIQANLLML